MKCPKCAYDQSRKRGMCCLGCGYDFVFDPKSGLRIADGYFAALIRNASADDTVWFTRRQLYSALCRKRYRGTHLQGKVASIIASIVAVGIVIVFATTKPGTGIRVPAVFFGGFILFVCLLMILGRVFYRPPRFEALDAMIDRWEKANGPIEKLVSAPSMHEAPPEWSESDVYDYGVERILVVQHDLLVDLLVKNGWHAEHRALVIAMSGYPSYLLPHAERLLRERPDLPVFLLHDSDADGMAMRETLRRDGLLPLQDHPVTDLGLSPHDVARLARLAPLRPKASNNALPVDSLGYGALSLGVGSAIAGSMTLGALLEERAQAAAAASEVTFG